MPYLTINELNQDILELEDFLDGEASPGERRAIIYSGISNTSYSTEKKHLIYAYWNLQQYKTTQDKSYFKEARKYFEKVAMPYLSPNADKDYRNQAHFFLGQLWETASSMGHADLSENDGCDPRHLAVKHYQQVKLLQEFSDATDLVIQHSLRDSSFVQHLHGFIIARQQLATLYLGDLSSFPSNQNTINAPGIFKADHLRSIVAIIEIFHVQQKILKANPNSQLLINPTPPEIEAILSRFCSIPELKQKHLVFTGALDPAQQYKIARACFDRKLIDEENFHAILRRIHHSVRDSDTADDQQLRRNVKFYLAKMSLRLYYKVGQSAQKKEQYINDLTSIYNDLIGSKKALYREAIAREKPKALSARAMINQFMSNGSQKVPYSDPLTHGVEVTTPFMSGFGKAFYIPFMILGFIIDLVPRIIMSGGTLILQALALPFAVVIGLFCCCCCRTPSRGGDYDSWMYFLMPLLLLAVIFQPWFSSNDSVGMWGQRIENRWLDTGFTFMLGKVGSFLGNGLGFVIGAAISIATYIPRLLIQGLRNCVRSDDKMAEPEQISDVLKQHQLDLDVDKPPLDYLRHDKHYRNYQDSAQRTGAKKYKDRFCLYSLEGAELAPSQNRFRWFTEKDPRTSSYYAAPPAGMSGGASAPTLHEDGAYEEYVGSAPPFEPSDYDHEVVPLRH